MKRDDILDLLPEIFQRTAHENSPLTRLLDVMEGLHEPDEAILTELDRFFDPYRAPDAFVPMLATWVDLGELVREMPETPTGPPVEPLATGIGRLRALVASAAYLSQWRGTRLGLRRFLETATGAQGFELDEAVRDEAGAVRPYHVRVVAPAKTAPYRPLLEKIIELEKPAYVTFELTFAEKEAAKESA
jgi:phage tail-like protein